MFIVCCAALCRYTVDIAIPRPVCGPVHETETGHVQALEIDNNVWFYVCSFLFVFLIYIFVVIVAVFYNFVCLFCYCNRTCGPFLILGSGGGWRLPRRDTHTGINHCL